MYISDAERTATPPSFDYDSFELPENTSLTMRLSPHDSPADLPPEKELHNEIKQNDVVILEAIVSSEESLLLRKVSQGSYKDYQKFRIRAAEWSPDFGDWFQAIGAALYGSRVIPTLVDINGRDPLVRKFNNALHVLDQKIVRAKTEDELLTLKPDLIIELEAVKGRDQKILQNIAPKLGELCARNRILGEKREREPLRVLAMYGAFHRSLFDALVHKSNSELNNGFNVQDHPSSLKNFLHESMYAYHLRELDIPDETMIQHYTQVNIAAGLRAGNYLQHDRSTEEMNRMASILAEGRTYAQSRELGRRLIRQELLIAEPGDATSEDLENLCSDKNFNVVESTKDFLLIDIA